MKVGDQKDIIYWSGLIVQLGDLYQHVHAGVATMAAKMHYL